MLARRTTAFVRTGVLAATGAALTALCTGTSSAGTNGQQIHFRDQRGDVYSVSLSGTNQNGESVSHCFDTPGPDNYLSGWWWKDDLTITWYPSAGCDGTAIEPSPEVFTIPPSQPSDWYLITDK
ncbi:hypothetical protein AV521_34005 [Streptomyces sp. IMTB 2501]|uniref:hypothetical protein n=1 Tax=Streptomyces sp. IMTB 2501 TaxID=1776340 RepID=UPI00096DC926|nr:hypothetical protein [Streptomyces sp. IMTB 2501]OLZ64968.1 hypothetical protein AV521_34005 [Streptomyces sp. IMTB 2501]